ncbi:MAG: branched-chain amino acid ABC transporter permease [bacterium]|nr:branched-chain amino acid ABC transporter permease [bacterium]MDT8396337.1 branched-chain amino acid ABC transporter permease [bacterium]
MLLEQLSGNLLQGLVLGAVYGMATMGLSLIFGVLQVVNVGHGAFIMVGSFTALMMFQGMGIPPVFAIPVAMLIGMGLGMLFYYGAMKPLVSPSGSGIRKMSPKVLGMAGGGFVGMLILMWIGSGLFKLNVAIYIFVGIIFIYGFFLYIYGGRRQDKAPELATLLVTFSLGVILEEVVKQIFTSESRGYNWDIGKLDVGITVFPYPKLLAAFGSMMIAILLYLWFKKTRAGMAMRSVVEDDVGARVCGVDVDWQYALSFSLGIGLTVTSGVLLTMFIPVGINPYMGGPYTLKAFVIAVLGGLASPYAAFFGGVVFGLLENGSYTLFANIPGVEPFAMTRFFSFVMLLVILLIRPTGLLRAK